LSSKKDNTAKIFSGKYKCSANISYLQSACRWWVAWGVVQCLTLFKEEVLGVETKKDFLYNCQMKVLAILRNVTRDKGTWLP
jgi:hypothetical protein